MTRLYGGALIAASLLHWLAALGPSPARAPSLVAGQIVMLIGIWGLGFVAIPHAARAGWAMVLAGLVGSILLAVAFTLDTALGAWPIAEPVGTFAAETAVVAVFVSASAGAWSLFRAPGAWRAVAWCLLFAAAAIPITWLEAAVVAQSLENLVLSLRLGVSAALLAYALGTGWAGALLWRAAG